jgi:hypothetical protein
MPMSDNFESNFEEIVLGLGSLVGENEIQARRALGDERYDKTVAFFEDANLLLLKKEAAHVKHVESVTNLYSSISIFMLISLIMGVAWSFYFWFS